LSQPPFTVNAYEYFKRSWIHSILATINKTIHIIYFLGAWCLLSSLGSADEIEFNHLIRPLLSRHCIACHGPDEGDRQADLRLDSFENATEYAIVPGDADGSDVMDRITTDDAEMRMPPADHAAALNSKEIELLRLWINEGAKYQSHWAFSLPQNPTVPDVLKLARKSKEKIPRIHNFIDNFILEPVYRAGLKQNPPASPDSLIRRVSLDLTGYRPSLTTRTCRLQSTVFSPSPTRQTSKNSSTNC
jgi:hypothetical protein